MQRQRIEQVINQGGGELDQADLLLVGVQAVLFGIDSQNRVLSQYLHHLSQLPGLVDPGGFG